MNTLYLEELHPLVVLKGRSFLMKNRGPWNVVAPRLPSKALETLLGTVITPVEIEPDNLHSENWNLFRHLQELSSTDSNALEKSTSRALFALLLPITVSRALGNVSPREDRFVVATRWPSIHRDTAPSIDSMEIVSPRPSILLIWESLTFLARAAIDILRVIANRFRTPDQSIGKPTVGVIAGPGMPADHVQTLFQNFEKSDIYIHWADGASRGIERDQNYRSQIASQGWSYWRYRDCLPERALRIYAQAIPSLLRAGLSSKAPDLAIARRKLSAYIARRRCELDDLFRVSSIRLVVLSAERDAMADVIAERARSFGVRTVNIFNGLHPTLDPQFSPAPFDLWLLWNASQRDAFQSAGIAPHSICVTGHINSDEISCLAEARSSSTFPRRSVVYFSQFPLPPPAKDTRVRWAVLLKELLRTDPDLTIVVKPHPSEDVSFLKRLWEGAPRVRIVDPDIRSLDLLVTARAAVATNSTTLLEAMAVGVPTVRWDPAGLLDSFAGTGACFPLHREEKPTQALFALLNDETKLQRLASAGFAHAKNLFGPLDGKSNERISGEIRRLFDAALAPKRRALFVSYRFPPQNPAGSIRAIKWAKYLARKGWAIDILAPTEGATKDFGNDLQDPNIRVRAVPSRQPFEFVLRALRSIAPRRAATSAATTKRPSHEKLRSKMRWWLRPLLLLRFPDEAAWWGRSLRRAVDRYFEEAPDCRVIYAHGPPFSPFLQLCRGVKRWNKPMVFDFRDPWSADRGYLIPFPFLAPIVKRWEKKVFSSSARFITVTASLQTEFEALAPECRGKIVTIPNGFDPEDFERKQESLEVGREKDFRLVHAGSLAARDARFFLEALRTALDGNPDMSKKTVVDFYGDPEPRTIATIDKIGLGSVCRWPGRIPHARISDLGRAASLFLLIQSYSDVDTTALPGKIFEYAAMRKPIFGFGWRGEASWLLHDLRWGRYFDEQVTTREIAFALIEAYRAWERGKLCFEGSDESVIRFSRKNLCDRIEEQLLHD